MDERRPAGLATINPAEERTGRGHPVHEHDIDRGPDAKSWHGTDIAYFVNLLVAAVLYGGYRLLAARLRTTDD